MGAMVTRRNFLKSLVFGSGGLAFPVPTFLFRRLNRSASPLGPRAGRTNPFVNSQGQARLVCIEGHDVSIMLRKGLLALGGLEKLIKTGDSVFLKPNLVLRESDPDAPLFPTMSSPDCIRELIWLLRGHTTQIQVGDQGGEDQDTIYDALDLVNVVTGAGAELVDLERMADPTRAIRHASWDPQVPDFNVFRAVYEAPVLISLCNLKRHSSAQMTAAIKNNFGAMQGRWDSGTRGWLHRNPNLSPAFLAELPYVAALMKPELTIVDARHIMIGNGPILSFPGAKIKTGINRMVLGGDMVALDSYCAQHILADHDPDFDPESIRLTLTNAEQLGLGTSDLSRVDILEIDETWEPPPKKGAHRR
jgi:uncharacterized protein (DUF362 family)